MKIMNGLSDWFFRQKRNSQLLIGGLGLFLVLGLCGLLSVTVIRIGQSPAVTATYPGANSVLFVTWTPATTDTPEATGTITPTATLTLTSTPVLTRTPLPTGLPTLSLATVTSVVLPTAFSPGTGGVLVVITYVDKKLEYVDIQNAGISPVSLNGWVLVSEIGDQSCPLRGILGPKEVLRIWAGTGQVGISCEFKHSIWLDEGLDPAVLYNAKGQEVSRYPKPTPQP